MKIALGVLLALGIGVVCRIAGIPVPAPPAIVGALLVLSMTVGYAAMDRYATHRPSCTQPLCGGPDGSVSRPEDRP